MNINEHLLTCLAEECSEVAQRVSKALRFGLDEVQAGQPLTNAERIAEEMVDLNAVCCLIQAHRLLPRACFPTPEQAEAKAKKISRYLEISQREGALSDG